MQRVTSLDAHRAARRAPSEAARLAARSAGDAASAAYLHPIAQAGQVGQVGQVLRASANAAWIGELAAGGDPAMAMPCWSGRISARHLRDRVAQMQLCGEGEVEPAQVGDAGPSRWGVGPPGVHADEVDGGGGKGVFEFESRQAGARVRASHLTCTDGITGRHNAGATALASGTVDALATLTTPNLLPCRPDLTTPAARVATTALLTARDRLARDHPEAGQINIRTGIATKPVPLHPGAAAYFRAASP